MWRLIGIWDILIKLLVRVLPVALVIVLAVWVTTLLIIILVGICLLILSCLLVWQLLLEVLAWLALLMQLLLYPLDIADIVLLRLTLRNWGLNRLWTLEGLLFWLLVDGFVPGDLSNDLSFEHMSMDGLG